MAQQFALDESLDEKHLLNKFLNHLAVESEEKETDVT